MRQSVSSGAVVGGGREVVMASDREAAIDDSHKTAIDGGREAAIDGGHSKTYPPERALYDSCTKYALVGRFRSGQP